MKQSVQTSSIKIFLQFSANNTAAAAGAAGRAACNRTDQKPSHSKSNRVVCRNLFSATCVWHALAHWTGGVEQSVVAAPCICIRWGICELVNVFVGMTAREKAAGCCWHIRDDSYLASWTFANFSPVSVGKLVALLCEWLRFGPWI